MLFCIFLQFGALWITPLCYELPSGCMLSPFEYNLFYSKKNVTSYFFHAMLLSFRSLDLIMGIEVESS